MLVVPDCAEDTTVANTVHSVCPGRSHRKQLGIVVKAKLDKSRPSVCAEVRGV